MKSGLEGIEKIKKPQCKRRKNKIEINKNMRGYWVSLAAKNMKRKDDPSPCSDAVDAPVQSPSVSPNGGSHCSLSTRTAEPLNPGAKTFTKINDDSTFSSEKGLGDRV